MIVSWFSCISKLFGSPSCVWYAIFNIRTSLYLFCNSKPKRFFGEVVISNLGDF